MIRALIIGLANAYTTIIFIYVIMSWIPHSTGVVGDVYRILGKLCDPYLDLFKKLIPPIGGMVDITPIIALLVLQLVVRFVVGII
ncbi:MAG: YggT family protein [Eggerthellaceae bacterium]|nr:YggT family protein [Eggerthellaceae bacterium]